MTGPEHYLKAQELLVIARDAYSEMETAGSDRQKAEVVMASAGAMGNIFAQAQAHATLALVAATAASLPPGDLVETAWEKAIYK